MTLQPLRLNRRSVVFSPQVQRLAPWFSHVPGFDTICAKTMGPALLQSNSPLKRMNEPYAQQTVGAAVTVSVHRQQSQVNIICCVYMA